MRFVLSKEQQQSQKKRKCVFLNIASIAGVYLAYTVRR